ncbi:hypothetical protein [Nitrosophilus alvini]|uniref:hypothetical protein n=1 Tax=Nitrosophilus alvini TaxID=2714855 RepID=UPI00190C01FE|nr:hypothetical protein [Nitrosophilus alvini]
MSNDLEKLKKIGIEEIHKRTYIAHRHIESLLEGDFSKFDKVQALGFVKIIEREFDVDLNELRNDIKSRFSEGADEVKSRKVLEKKEKLSANKKPTFPFIAAVLIVLLAASVFLFYQNDVSDSVESKKTEEEILLQKSEEISDKKEFSEKSLQEMISQEKKEIEKNTEKLSSKDNFEKNDTLLPAAESEKILKKETAEEKKRRFYAIEPKQKVWVGIIYLDNFKKKQLTTKEPVELNASRDQLIVTGHGMIRVLGDSNITDIKSKDKKYFLIQKGILKEIDKEEFKSFNRGRNW